MPDRDPRALANPEASRRRGKAAGAGLFAVLCAAVAGLTPGGPVRAQQPPAAGAPASQGVPVQAVAVRKADVPVLLRNIGSVQAYQSVLVRARVDGTLERIFFTEGQDVKVGDSLALIDPRPYAAVLAQAKAKRAADESQLGNAQRDLTRYSNLASRDFASRQQVDTQSASVAQFTANLQGDDATIATAQLNLNFCNITSPIEGRVGLRMVDIGNLIHASDATGIVTITQVHPISVIFTLPQDTLPQIRAAMARSKLPVQAYTSDDKTLLSQGELLTTDNTIDQTTGTIRLKAVFANTDDKLWPGQFVNARLQVDTLKDALVVPSATIQRGPDGVFVYVVKPDQTVAVQAVGIRQDDGQIAVIDKGLDNGASVVLSGQSRLQAGVKVAVAQPKTSS